MVKRATHNLSEPIVGSMSWKSVAKFPRDPVQEHIVRFGRMLIG
jgi:hypothetical protein